MIDITNVGTKQTQFLRRAYEQKRLAHSYLFVDSDESRALNTAYWLACLFKYYQATIRMFYLSDLKVSKLWGLIR